LYIGDFETDGEFGRLDPATGKPIARHLLSRELVVQRLLESPLNLKTSQDIPSEWPVWFESGYILCKRDELREDAVDFLLRVVKLFDCKIIDVGNGLLVNPEEVRPRVFVNPRNVDKLQQPG
jgi:hypothetical protein